MGRGGGWGGRGTGLHQFNASFLKRKERKGGSSPRGYSTASEGPRNPRGVPARASLRPRGAAGGPVAGEGRGCSVLPARRCWPCPGVSGASSHAALREASAKEPAAAGARRGTPAASAGPDASFLPSQGSSSAHGWRRLLNFQGPVKEFFLLKHCFPWGGKFEDGRDILRSFSQDGNKCSRRSQSRCCAARPYFDVRIANLETWHCNPIKGLRHSGVKTVLKRALTFRRTKQI
ncbi:uncharacterized protein LOC142051989 [Phalacrocorax aristotelis]|uniref:uncharacterized protein LOC142051989 n=1 Tax=Phalacrocorax aristotelis TaxID=126867 RepID=UPI003F4BB8E3